MATLILFFKIGWTNFIPLKTVGTRNCIIGEVEVVIIVMSQSILNTRYRNVRVHFEHPIYVSATQYGNAFTCFFQNGLICRTYTVTK